MADSEVVITADLVRQLLEDQHLAELPLREVDGGWGNQMWRLGDEMAVRIQRMATDPEGQLQERRWLPLAKKLIDGFPAGAPPGRPTPGALGEDELDGGDEQAAGEAGEGNYSEELADHRHTALCA